MKLIFCNHQPNHHKSKLAFLDAYRLFEMCPKKENFEVVIYTHPPPTSKLNSNEGSDFDLFLSNHLRPINFCLFFSPFLELPFLCCPLFPCCLESSSNAWTFWLTDRGSKRASELVDWFSSLFTAPHPSEKAEQRDVRLVLGVNKNYLSEIIMRIKYIFIDFFPLSSSHSQRGIEIHRIDISMKWITADMLN